MKIQVKISVHYTVYNKIELYFIPDLVPSLACFDSGF